MRKTTSQIPREREGNVPSDNFNPITYYFAGSGNHKEISLPCISGQTGMLATRKYEALGYGK